VQRRSTPEAILADNFSRKNTIKTKDLKSIEHLFTYKPKGSLLKWLENTTPDWSFPKCFINKITEHVNFTQNKKK